VGYVLDPSYDMPPLMLTPNEIEAAVLGAQWVAERGDPALARGARDLMAKIRDVVPEHLRPMILQASVVAPCLIPQDPDPLDLEALRAAVRDGRKLRIQYRDKEGLCSDRIVWPVAVAYFQAVRLQVGWCELRAAFRHFRTDRIEAVEFLAERYPPSAKSLHAAWRAEEDGRPIEPRMAPEALRRSSGRP
jgi:predicted DNA-binding transcriptional regulator YafY